MKRAGCILSAICLMAVLVGLTAAMGHSLEVQAEGTYAVGDIDNSATVDKNDANALVAHLTGETLLTDDALAAASTDGVERVDVKDLVRYRRYLTEASDTLTPTNNVYYINTLSDLLCLQRMVNDKEFNTSNTPQFDGKSIKLTVDIEVNVVDLANESTGELSVSSTDQLIKEWTPIGKGGTFGGVFSGYDTVSSSDAIKEISGIYISATDAVQGLFGDVRNSGSVNNFKLKNSYIATTFGSGSSRNAHVGSFVGTCTSTLSTSKTFKNLYSDAVIVCNNGQRVGGIIGNLATNADTTMENCMYAGHLTAYTHCAGIVGRSALGSATDLMPAKVTNIVNCENYGVVKAMNKGGYVGEIVGVQDWTKRSEGVYQTKKLSLNECLGTGSINAASSTTVLGALVGKQVTTNNNYTSTNLASDTTKLVNCLAVGEYKIGNNVSDLSIVGGYDSTVTTEDYFDVTGSDVFTGANLSGTDYYRLSKVTSDLWSEYADNHNIEVTANTKKANLSWYYDGTYDGSSSDKAYKIDSAEDMRGIELIERLENTNFEGKYFKLTADIKDLSSESDLWISLGKTNAFNGTFDGGGHTIDQMYVVANTRGSGLFGYAGDNSVLRNIRLDDSCRITVDGSNTELCASNRVFAGSLVGQSSGTIENIYSEATVGATSGKEIGGIVGLYTGDTTKTISNCWFNGEATSTMQYVGGIVGRIMDGSKTVQDCLNTGLVQGNASGSAYVGGICGGADSSSNATFTRCVNNGGVKNTGAGTKSLGSVLGGANDSVTLTDNAGLYTITGFTATAKGTVISEEPYTTTTVNASTDLADLLGTDWSYNTETGNMNLNLTVCDCGTTE